MFFALIPFLPSALPACVQEAPALSSEKATLFLISSLKDRNPEIRSTAAESLGKIGDRAAIESLLPLLGDTHPAVRVASARALGHIGPPSDEHTLTELVHALEDPNDAVKQAAATAIGELEPRSKDLEPLVKLVEAPDPTVRRAAVQALLQTDASRWRPALMRGLHDSDETVRQGVVAIIGASPAGPEVAIELRKSLIEDKSPAVRAEAAYQLGRVEGVETLSALEQVVATDPDRGVRRWAQAALRLLRGSD